MADPKEYSRLKDGHYKITGNWYKVLLVEGEAAKAIGTIVGDIPVGIEYGEFGEADPKISEITGHSTYNIEVTVTNDGQAYKERGVITENGVKMKTKSMIGICEYEWVTEEEAAELLADGDPIEAPPAPYKLQPENQGQLLWFTGPPGLGKSTSAQLLARNNGYVYYEADCFNGCKNPYVPVDVEDPTMAQTTQRPLKGEGLEERKEVIRKMMKDFGLLMKGEHEKDFYEDYYTLMCEDIQREKERIGGDWAVAQCVMLRGMRDFIRTKLGPEFVFVVLEMELDDMKDRVIKRHDGDPPPMDWLETCYKLCEPAVADEENVITVKVTNEMTREDVVQKALEMLK